MKDLGGFFIYFVKRLFKKDSKNAKMFTFFFEHFLASKNSLFPPVFSSSLLFMEKNKNKKGLEKKVENVTKIPKRENVSNVSEWIRVSGKDSDLAEQCLLDWLVERVQPRP